MKLEIPETIRLVAPLWTQKLETRKTWKSVKKGCIINGQKLDINDWGCCIVGETLNLFKVEDITFHDLKLHKDCQTCLDTSMILFRDIDNIPYGYTNKKEFEEDLKEYADHIKKQHKSIITRARKKLGN